MGADMQRGLVTAPGSWENKVNTTPLDEVGWLVAAAVVDPQARNVRVYGGEPIDYKQLADLLDAARGKPLERRIRTVEEAQKGIEVNTHGFTARLLAVIAEGTGVWWPTSNNYSARSHPEHKPLSLADWIKTNVKPAEKRAVRPSELEETTREGRDGSR